MGEKPHLVTTLEELYLVINSDQWGYSQDAWDLKPFVPPCIVVFLGKTLELVKHIMKQKCELMSVK